MRNFSHVTIDESTINNILVEENNFTIKTIYENIYGVAKLVEIGNERHYFQFVFRQKTRDYNLLRKYLNRYVKVKY